MKEKGISKQERVCHRDDFNFLFSDGKSFYSYPFRCIFCEKESANSLVRIGISVSKKKFKHATDRNRIKRLTREAYRLEKRYLSDKMREQAIALDLLIIYTEDKLLEYRYFQNGMRILLKKTFETYKASKENSSN